MNHRLKTVLDNLGYDLAQDQRIRERLLNAILEFALARHDAEIEGACRAALTALRDGVTDGEANDVAGALKALLDAVTSGSDATGVKELDGLLSLSRKMPPVEEMRRVFAGIGGSDDREAVKFYVEMLERFKEHPTREYVPAEPGQILAIGDYAFSPPDAKEGQSRDFIVTVYQDRSATWVDEQGKLRARADKNVVIKTMLGDHRARKALEREESEFTVETTIGDDAYWAVAEKEAIMAQGWDLPDDVAAAIDRVLAVYFWRDVNPLLPQPLTRL